MGVLVAHLLVFDAACTVRPVISLDAQSDGHSISDAIPTSLQTICRGSARAVLSDVDFPISAVSLRFGQVMIPNPRPPKLPFPPFWFTFHGKTPDGVAAVIRVTCRDGGAVQDSPPPVAALLSEGREAWITYAKASYPDAGTVVTFPYLDELTAQGGTFVGWVGRTPKGYSVCISATSTDPSLHPYLRRVIVYAGDVVPEAS